ncbi:MULTISPECIES: response regulator transcription factor [Mammaliicoccus]|uniref:Heme response regulator HssR n=1 Tax=Mammaliicoccus fleurettii TaxID=150056 RepID=A0ABS5MJ78_9STAP|nr:MULTISPECIES: response regulator transcription factor [Mammaliicoccus]HCN60587.1 DNA-binding response regulator [Staphylococcus sp.]MBL0846928.1 response regulator transcription factor [Mammaliicoccus fleurettii]MBO3062864.1 response regulator transcription factor [Mammaliicoccus fleurettii]MBS3670891.1 response regulator transcription factor [Mammaliicoccus fleurettii]MBS3695950.1 response regulator transcription factor [Mammaliicoccus fleurettii]
MVTCLVVDDDRFILNDLKREIERENINVVTSLSGEEALEVVEHKYIDLAVVDIMMPGMNGFELCQTLKESFDIPVIMLTARDELSDKENAFLAGTDDYVTKPFEMKELLFRIKAVLRRFKINSSSELKIGNTLVNSVDMEITINQKSMLLPKKEFALLDYLMRNKDKVLQRDKIIEVVWGIDFEGDERTLDVHIKRLRKRLEKLESDVLIKTVRGVGYKAVLEDEV